MLNTLENLHFGFNIEEFTGVCEAMQNKKIKASC